MILTELAPETKGLIPVMLEAFKDPPGIALSESGNLEIDRVFTKLGRPGVEAILPLLTDPEYGVRVQRVLQSMKPSEEIVNILGEKLKDPETDLEFRVEIVRMLASGRFVLNEDANKKLDLLLKECKKTAPQSLQDEIDKGLGRKKIYQDENPGGIF